MLANGLTMDKGAHEVHISTSGTSGRNEPAPGDGPWTGVVDPLKQGQPIPGTEATFGVVYGAERFDTVDINPASSHAPTVTVTQSWTTCTSPGVAFSLTRSGFHAHANGYHGRHRGVERGIDPPAQADKRGTLLYQWQHRVERRTLEIRPQLPPRGHARPRPFPFP
jgi:hypothetical protein